MCFFYVQYNEFGRFCQVCLRIFLDGRLFLWYDETQDQEEGVDGTMMVIDISQEVFSCTVYPGDPAPQRIAMKQMADGELYNLSMLSMCVHNGTHIDAPAHFLADGKTVEQMDLSACIGRCYVHRHEGVLSSEDADAVCNAAEAVGGRERILLGGGTVVTDAAAEVFVRRGVRLVGVDTQSVGDAAAPMAVHLRLLRAGVVLLEGLVLAHVKDGAYTLCAAPLNLGGCEGAPCRAVLMTDGV